MSLVYNTLNNKTTINSEYLNDNIYNLLDQTFIMDGHDYTFKIFKVTRDYIARPDLISYDAYGDTSYTDVICKINGISNPFELNEGMEIVLPDAEYINDFTITVSDEAKMQDDDDDTSITPQPVYQSSEREANQSVIGDNRFKIDSTNGIIIY